eukprot:CAMPEP_0184971338 /NCGR_PEP_ID=MMETSP1098-20130426/3592_1 /TAXON_ID=89044 /ORGANISM="Spumella elongata, Strain CCAP 955/1" /LENGTH=130 /DNA_ID=CAMNT_0027493443 /DNA_START=1456 /DNA_END=1844 /DNA_ORIENTATION=-
MALWLRPNTRLFTPNVPWLARWEKSTGRGSRTESDLPLADRPLAALPAAVQAPHKDSPGVCNDTTVGATAGNVDDFGTKALRLEHTDHTRGVPTTIIAVTKLAEVTCTPGHHDASFHQQQHMPPSAGDLD